MIERDAPGLWGDPAGERRRRSGLRHAVAGGRGRDRRLPHREHAGQCERCRRGARCDPPGPAPCPRPARGRPPALRRLAALVRRAAVGVAACSGSSRSTSPRPRRRPRAAAAARSRPTARGRTWRRRRSASTPRSSKRRPTAEVGSRTVSWWQATGSSRGVVLPGDERRHRQEVFSATKSFTSTLVGLAVDAGKAQLADRAATWIPEWRDTRRRGDRPRPAEQRLGPVVVDRAGLRGAAARRGPDRFAIGLTQTSAPGTVWAYNNSAIQTLERVVAGTLGADVPAARARPPVRPARHGPHRDDDRPQRPRHDVRGHPLDVPDLAGSARCSSRAAMERTPARVRAAGCRRRPARRPPRSTRATGCCGG